MNKTTSKTARFFTVASTGRSFQLASTERYCVRHKAVGDNKRGLNAISNYISLYKHTREHGVAEGLIDIRGDSQ